MRRGPCYSFARFLQLAASIGTFRAGAKCSQKVPGIDAVLVAVVPAELDRVFAYSACLQRLGSGLEHRQRPGVRFHGFTRLTLSLRSLLIAHRTGASIAQILERIVALVTVLPLDIHAVAGRQVHFHRLRVSRSRNLWGFYGHVISIA